MTDKELLLTAIKEMEKSYSPYSSCKVGAALLCKNGKVYTGTNIENAAFSPTICAERVAIFKAVSDGEREFSKIAVAGGKDGIVDGIFAPCGVCRQVLREFCSDDFQIILGENDEEYKVVTLKDLLPLSFSPDNVR
ncbi:MAG: cytidine deaminase [Ruminococcaceae bacterium]|nr:cytidine deaminase [Oscillospiraceae bacterium]